MNKVLKLYGVAVVLGMLTGGIAALFQLGIAALNKDMAILFDWLNNKGLPVGLCSGVLSMSMVLGAWLLVRYVAPDASGSGVPEIEGSLLHRRSMYWYRLIPVKFFGGMLSLCAKMVMGREGPTIQLGGNLGQMLGRLFRLSTHRSDTLIAAGSAAGLAAAFNAPLAGVLFVMEEMRNAFNYSFINLKMVIIACVAATITVQVFVGNGPSIPMKLFELPQLSAFWMFLLFGVVVGFFGLLFNQVLMTSLHHIDKLTLRKKIIYVSFVGLMIGVLQFYFPAFVGGGYTIISDALTLSPSFSMLCVLLLGRFVTTMFSYCTGIPGGIFAPMLALGTLLGLAMFHIFSYFGITASVQPGIFAVAGMAALFAACVRSPITGVILVVEMTQNYSLILPLMVSCIAATTVVQIARNQPIYTQLLQRSLKLNSIYDKST